MRLEVLLAGRCNLHHRSAKGRRGLGRLSDLTLDASGPESQADYLTDMEVYLMIKRLILVALTSCLLLFWLLAAPAPAHEPIFEGTVLVPAAKCLTWCGDPTEECINAGGQCKELGFTCRCIIPV